MVWQRLASAYVVFSTSAMGLARLISGARSWAVYAAAPSGVVHVFSYTGLMMPDALPRLLAHRQLPFVIGDLALPFGLTR